MYFIIFGFVINIFRWHKLITFTIYSWKSVSTFDIHSCNLHEKWTLYYLFSTLKLCSFSSPSLTVSVPVAIIVLHHHQNIFIYFPPFFSITRTWTCILHTKNRWSRWKKTNEANQITFHIVITMAHNLRPVKFIFLMVNKIKIAPHVLLLLSALDCTHGPNGLNNGNCVAIRLWNSLICIPYTVYSCALVMSADDIAIYLFGFSLFFV